MNSVLRSLKKGGELRIRVPCSTSNLGPGFDCLGAALSKFLSLRVQIREEGEGMNLDYGQSEFVPDVSEGEDLIRRAYQQVREGEDGASPSLDVTVNSDIPPGGGLGASGSATVAGLLLGYAMKGILEPDSTELFREAYHIEGHPDNAAPSVFGGITLAYQQDGTPGVQRIAEDLPETYLIRPHLRLETDRARKILPRNVPLQDAVRNLSATGLLVYSLMEKRWDLLRPAMKDRLHEEYRLELIPGGEEAMETGICNRSYGVWISGAGPTLGCFVREGGRDVPEEMAEKFKSHVEDVTVSAVDLVEEGGRVELKAPGSN